MQILSAQNQYKRSTFFSIYNNICIENKITPDIKNPSNHAPLPVILVSKIGSVSYRKVIKRGFCKPPDFLKSGKKWQSQSDLFGFL